MKKNQKGFTLIELLAVIIILAIIALIAVPTILNIINNAREEADVNSAYGVVAAAETYYAQAMLTPEVGKAKGEVDLPINFVKTPAVGSDDKAFSALPVKGKVPENGTVTICGDNGTGSCANKNAGEVVVTNLKFGTAATYSTQANSEIEKDV